MFYQLDDIECTKSKQCHVLHFAGRDYITHVTLLVGGRVEYQCLKYGGCFYWIELVGDSD